MAKKHRFARVSVDIGAHEVRVIRVNGAGVIKRAGVAPLALPAPNEAGAHATEELSPD